MKKIILLCFCLLILSACTSHKPKGRNVEVTPQEVISMISNKEKNTFLLYVTTEECYSCEEYEKVIESLLQEGNFNVYHMNVDLNESDPKVKSALNELNVTIGDYRMLPMTYYFYQGTLLPENKKEGYIEKQEYREWLKGLRLIK